MKNITKKEILSVLSYLEDNLVSSCVDTHSAKGIAEMQLSIYQTAYSLHLICDRIRSEV